MPEEPPFNPLDDFPRSVTGGYIPIEPDRAEKKKIRRYYSKTGLTLLLSLVVTSVLGALMSGVTYLGVLKSGGHESVRLFSDELVMALMNMGVFLTANLFAFFVGCSLTHLRPSAFLRGGRKTSFPLLLTMIMAGFFIQTATTLLLTFVPIGSEPVMQYNSTVLSRVVTAVYYIIAAPIGEELLFRGVVLKNLSRANTGFGIVASSLLFGLYHQNPSQLFSAFFIGLLLGCIAVYTGSVKPCIAVHAAANCVSAGFGLLSDILPDYSMPVYILWCVFTLFFGLMALIYIVIVMKPVQRGYHHKTRGLAIAKGSAPLTAVFIILLLLSLR